MADAYDPVAAVFNTPELLEAILLNVFNLHTLLFSQRVNRTFQATISGSINLQEKLFFRQPACKKTSTPRRSNPFFWKPIAIMKVQNRLPQPIRIFPGGVIVLSNPRPTRSASETLRKGSWMRMYVSKAIGEGPYSHYWRCQRLWSDRSLQTRTETTEETTVGDMLELVWPEWMETKTWTESERA